MNMLLTKVARDILSITLAALRVRGVSNVNYDIKTGGEFVILSITVRNPVGWQPPKKP
jgi:hypothetical protein